MIATYLALVLAASCAHAADELKGVTKVRVEVADVDDDAKQCGLTKESIERRFLESAQFLSGIKIVNEARVPVLKVEALVMRPPGLCVAHFLVQLVRFESFNFAPRDKRMGTIELFRAGAIDTTPTTDGSQLLGVVENLGHALAQQWEEDNF
ncbi:hypothetical protein ACO2I3_15785 [Leptospira interrogans]